MQHRYCQEAVDQTLQDIRDDDRPMDGIPTVYGGDFMQILPVIVKGSRGEIVAACFQRSPLWQKMEILYLTENKHLEGSTSEDRDFAKWLLDVGHGQNSDEAGFVQLPNSMRCGSTIQHLINAIYPGIQNIDPASNNDQYFQERTILSARNDDVDEVNKLILDSLPGELHTFYGANTIATEAGIDQNGVAYPPEFISSLNIPGMPLTKLEVKIGASLMILRNLDPKNGICNGT